MTNLKAASVLHEKIAKAINEAGLHDFEVIGILAIIQSQIAENAGKTKVEEDGTTGKEAS